MDLFSNSNESDAKMIGPSDKPPQRGIYLLPNLLTTAALFSGFYAVVAAMKGNYDAAAVAIFTAMIADGLDGRVARLTNTQTPFGAQYDSLSDLVAFGVAPALVLYSWSLSALGKLGWLASFLYMAATALRLARFNIRVNDKEYFQGLPCPSAAGIVSSTVWFGASFQANIHFAIPIAIFTVIIASLMVSTIRYYSFKSVDFKGKVSFFTVVLLVFIGATVAVEPSVLLFVIFLLYVLSGPFTTLWQLRQMRLRRKKL